MDRVQSSLSLEKMAVVWEGVPKHKPKTPKP